MTFPVNLAVFPCGSEVALEIHRSLNNSIHCNLIGLNSMDDHGKFIYQNYIGGLPFVNEAEFIPALKALVKAHKIDAIYPAMDQVITLLKRNEAELNCKIIASSLEATEISLSKSKTYSALKDVIPTPQVFEELDSIRQYPVFLKPDIGYGSRGVKKVESKEALMQHIEAHPGLLMLEYLPGKEYTIDCFTDFEGKLLFTGPRQRSRITNGISVNTATMPTDTIFREHAEKINSKVKFSGAWFYQVKENADGVLTLMEIASRMAGSSSVYRAKGVNFALLSLFNAYEMPVDIFTNDYEVELDRAFDNKYRIKNIASFDNVYIDFDDTLVFGDIVNTKLVALIFHFINQGKQIHLITKHALNINDSLLKYKLVHLFDDVIHIGKNDCKWKYMKHKDAILIDDSFAERKEAMEHLGIPVFSVDMIEALL